MSNTRKHISKDHIYYNETWMTRAQYRIVKRADKVERLAGGLKK